MRIDRTTDLSAALTDVHALGPALLFLLAATSHNNALLVIGLAWAFCESMVRLLDGLVFRLNRFSFVGMVGAATSATFLGGALPIQIEVVLYGAAITPPADAQYVFNTDASLTASVALYLTAFRYVSGILACWDRPRWQRALGSLWAELAHPRTLSLAFAPAILLAITLVFAGLLISGWIAVNATYVVTDGSAETPIWLSLLFTALPTLAMLAVVIGTSRRNSIIVQAGALCSLVTALTFAFAFGRRTFLFTLLLALATWFWLHPRAVKPRMILMAAVCGIPMLLAVSIGFQAARLAQGDLADVMEQPSILDIVSSEAFLLRMPMTAADGWSDFVARAYSISFFVDIFERFTPEHVTMGQLFALSGPLRTIPSLLWPDKLHILADYAAPEHPVQRLLMLYETDQAMPIAIIGYVDWWLFGALISPLIVLAISFAFVTMASSSRHVVAKLAAVASAIIMAWNAEFEFAAAFVYLRFALLIYFVCAILGAMFVKRSAAPHMRERLR